MVDGARTHSRKTDKYTIPLKFGQRAFKNTIMKKQILNPFNKLPIEGSIYTHLIKGAYYGMTGIVHHHLDKKAFWIDCGNCSLVNIKP
jgi:hypothetical protein